MMRITQVARRFPIVATLLGAAVIGGSAYAALGATNASSQAEPAPTSQVPSLPGRDSAETRAIAEKAVKEAGQGAQPGSVRLVVPAAPATKGFSLWSWTTDDGGPAHMIVDPSGTAVAWVGCRPTPVRYADRCGGWLDAAGTLVLAGRAAPEVTEVRLQGAQLAPSSAALGSGGWLWAASGYAPDTPTGKVPDTVVAETADGAAHETPTRP